MNRRWTGQAVAATLAAWVLCGIQPATAQQGSAATFPDKPIRLVVPYPPGGSTDPVARLLASSVATKLGQPVVVDNKPGAAGAIGTEAVARAPADGYTLLLHTSVIATDPSLKKNASYDVKRDLAPLTLAVTGPYLMVVNPSLPIRTVADLIAYAKAHPGELNYGSAGQGSSGHLIGEMFKRAAGIDIRHVPYKGGGPSITALVGNEVQLLFDTMGGSRQLAETGKLRAIAVTSEKRSPLMPDVPTVADSGLKGFTAEYWLGLFAPARTPAPVMDKLYAAFKEAIELPANRAKLLEQGNVSQAQPPAEFARTLDADIQRYRAIIESARITLE